MLYFLSLFIISFLISYLSVDFIRKIGHKYDILLYPQEDRWHSKPIAVHGGIGFIPVFSILLMITSVMFSPISEFFQNQNNPFVIQEYYNSLIFIIALIGSASILFIFGWLDDIFNFSALSRLFIQIFVSSIFIIDIGTFQISESYLLNFTYTLLWFIGIINATNLMDCMDGLCGGILSIALIFLGAVILSNFSINDDQAFFSVNLMVILIGILFGFLALNLPPAKIFMGDSGSLPLGFIIASITLPSDFNGLDASDNIMIPIFLPILLLLYPILDTTLVTITRIIRGQKFYIGGKDHSCHRFVKSGLSEKYSLIYCYLIGTIGGLSALVLVSFPNLLLPLLSLNLCVFIGLIYYLGKIKI